MRIIIAWAGGGLKAIAPLTWAIEVERRAECQFHQVLNSGGGASTGGIIGIAIGLGWSMARIRDLYLQNAQRIFHRSLTHQLRTMRGLAGPKYPSSGLAGTLKESFGDRQFGELRIPTLIPAHEMPGGELVDGGVHALQPVDSVILQENRRSPGVPLHVIAVGHEPEPERARAVYFKSWDPEDGKLPAWLVAYMTSAAPTYFPGVTREGSFDTDSGDWGAPTWGMRFPAASLAGSEQSALWKAREILDLIPGSRLYDIRPPEPLGPMDDPSPRNLRRLQEAGIALLEHEREETERVIEVLRYRASELAA